MAILITGANRGVGLALAERAAAHKNTVIGTFRGKTAPTLSGIHDLERIIKVCQRFRMKIFVVINKG